MNVNSTLLNRYRWTLITDERKQMERWVEHYLELYSTENTVSEEALDSIKLIPIMVELD